MATVATLVQPAPDQTSIDEIAVPTTLRFPVPALTWGFMTEVEFELSITGLEPPYYVAGALVPYGDYLEPIIGQIWPR